MVSVVAPVFNNAADLPALAAEVAVALREYRAELILVDDGSTDHSWPAILNLVRQTQDLQIRGIRLARNCGQHAAILEGLKVARGGYTAVIDADLQDDPAFLPFMIARAGAGYDIVHGRRERAKLTWRPFLSLVAHALLSFASDIRLYGSVGNYKLLSRRAVDAVLAAPGSQPLLAHRLARLDLPYSYMEIKRRRRPVPGSGYTYRKALGFFFSLIYAYSDLPYYLLFLAGAGLIAAAHYFLAGMIWIAAGVACWVLGGIGFYRRRRRLKCRATTVVVVENVPDRQL
jgi:polyisoprenyl-phosphate glycosyltransferase